MQLNQGGTTQFGKVGDVDRGGQAISVFVCSKCRQEKAPFCTVQWRVVRCSFSGEARKEKPKVNHSNQS